MVRLSGFDRDLYIDVFLLVHPLFVPSVTVLDHLRQTCVLFLSPLFLSFICQELSSLGVDVSRLWQVRADRRAPVISRREEQSQGLPLARREVRATTVL